MVRGSPNGRVPVAKKYKQHAEREQIAAPVVANVEQLLRRDIDAGADRACELFAGKIGQIEMAGETEIEQHHLAAAGAPLAPAVARRRGS